MASWQRAIARAGFNQLHPRNISSSSNSGFLRRADPIASDAIPWSIAKRYAVAGTREVRVKSYISTPGVIVEPYERPPPPLPFFQRWFTKQGWKFFKQNAHKLLKSAYAIAKIKQKHKGYGVAQFYKEATDLYKEVNKAFARGDMHVLRRLVTEMHLPHMKKQIKHREGIWDKVQWEIVGPIKLLKTQQARLLGIDPNNPDDSFVQITLRVQCYQIFAAYDKKGKLVAGDPNKQLLVEDQWVLEKHLTNPLSVWRLCGQLG